MQRDGGPGGAGGAGNPVGGGFTGAAQALEILGDHAYALSGPMSGDTSNFVTHLSFTTGNFYLDGSMNFYGGTIKTDVLGGTMVLFKIEYNGVEVLVAKTSANPEAMPAWVHVPVIIPPYTEVIVSGLVANTVSDTVRTYASISGRIYRG